VLYIDGEMAAVQMQQRLVRFGPVPESLRFLLADLNRGPLLDLAHGDSQYRLTASWGDPELVVLDNLASLAGLRRGNPDRWHELHRFLMLQRQWGRGVLMIHHANKRGVQRGTGRREDILDLVMAMRRPTGWQPGDGTEFEVHFEKARTLHSAAIQPIRVGLEDTPDGFAWRHQPIDETMFERVVALLNRGRNAAYVADALNLSRSGAYRLRDRAIALGRLHAATTDESTQAESRP
jgi:putative DNA primase/helicase